MRNGGVLLRANRELSEKASSFGMAGSVYQDELAGNARQREGRRAGVHDMPLLVTAAVIRGEVMRSWQKTDWQRTVANFVVISVEIKLDGFQTGVWFHRANLASETLRMTSARSRLFNLRHLALRPSF